MYKGVGEVFLEYKKLFDEYIKGEDISKEKISDLSKISGSMGYMAQVHAGLAKAYDHEKRLAEIEKKLESNSEVKSVTWGK
jgi:hypothetical protein